MVEYGERLQQRLQLELQLGQSQHEQQQSQERTIGTGGVGSIAFTMSYQLTRQQLYKDLHTAYLCARRHKRKKDYQQRFEAHVYAELESLCDELWNRTYKAQPSEAFLIHDPKIREVFAANFRDRIVHHLYFNYVHELLERTFIQDSYSCINDRGTHYGIGRLEKYIRKESQNYTQPCYVLKMDISGYFMHIDRQRLLTITLASLQKMAEHRVSTGSEERWDEKVDMQFVVYLTREIILLDPTANAIVKGRREAWKHLPKSKSLYYSPSGCGLPIGNLTSQLFSNVYLNVLDQWMKRELGCKAYGRYVDDFYVVSRDKEWLASLIPQVTMFLTNQLGLSVQPNKTQICNVYYGVDYLGATIKPYRKYVSATCVKRIRKHIHELRGDNIANSLNSFLGVLGHYSSFGLRKRIFMEEHDFLQYGKFNKNITIYKQFLNFML